MHCRIFACKAYASASVRANKWCPSQKELRLNSRFFNPKRDLHRWKNDYRWHHNGARQKGNFFLWNPAQIHSRFDSCPIPVCSGFHRISLLDLSLHDLLKSLHFYGIRESTSCKLIVRGSGLFFYARLFTRKDWWRCFCRHSHIDYYLSVIYFLEEEKKRKRRNMLVS